MKQSLLLLTGIITFCNFKYTRGSSGEPLSKNIHFDIAYYSIKNMLEGKEPVCFKKAVFLTENAYMGGRLNWQVFDESIKNTVTVFQDMITQNGFNGYKTAKNWAVHMYMVDTTTTANKYQRFNYDYESYNNDTIGLVSNLLKTHLGNCHCLPFLYKIYCNEIGAEAYLATAPMHAYIMQKDEYGEWWNIELTSRYRYLSNRDIIETFKITPVNKTSGLYMKPLSEKESLVLCLEDLLIYYHKRFDRKNQPIQDIFVQKCFQLGLKYKPASELLLDKFHYYKSTLDRKMKEKRLKEYKQLTAYPDLDKLYKTVDATAKKLHQFDYKNFDPKLYKQMVNDIEEKKKKYPAK